VVAIVIAVRSAQRLSGNVPAEVEERSGMENPRGTRKKGECSP